jgi:tetratricopeptide (TPR) repeat protein
MSRIALLSFACHFIAAGPLLAQVGTGGKQAHLSVEDAARLTWRLETRAEGIAALRTITADAPSDANALFELGRVLTWNVATRAEGIGLLRAVVEQVPDRLDAAEALAEALSWDVATRDEAVRRFRGILSRDPARASTRLKFAETLSWNPSTRDESRSLYQQALRDDAGSVEATVGLARVLSWSGRVSESREWYQLALTRNPSDQAARIGVAELDGWNNRPRASLKTLSAMPTGTIETPDAFRLRAQAYSQIGRPARALAEYERLLAIDPKNGSALQAAQSLRRELRPTIEIATEGSTSSGTPLSRIETAAVPLRFVFHPNRHDTEISLIAAQGLYRNSAGSSRERIAGAGVETPIGNRVRLGGAVISHDFDRAISVITGRGELQVAVHDTFDVRAGGGREQIASSRLSLTGDQFSGTFYGPAFVSQATLAVAARPGRGFDFWAQATKGRIEGVNLATNAREELFAGAGKSLYLGGATLRPGYSMSWMSYDRDLSGFPATHAIGDGIVAPGVGGYFSPIRFLNQMVRVDTTVPLGGSLVVVGGAGLGRQQIEQSNARDFSHRVASSDAYLGLRLSMGPTSIATQVTYQDVAAAFNRTGARMSLTYGF